MAETKALDKRALYRFPWSMNDNPIGWLEITDICNLHCEGCYRQTLSKHKTLEEIREEVLFLKRWRNPDNMSIAGGEPLLHPQIIEIVAFIRQQGIKPILLTNAIALTPDTLRELKRAGLAGFTIHIDSHQNRPGWQGRSEAEHNELRQHYADMIAEVGGLYTVFNSTVYPSTYHEIGDVVRWGRQHIDRVHGLVFITYRTATTEDTVGLDAGSHVVDLSQLSYSTEHFDEAFVTGPEVVQAIYQTEPSYWPAGYLGGTLRHDSFKWIAGALIGNEHGIYGSVGPRAMELAQVVHHFFRGTYLAYLSQSRIGAKVFALSLIDPAIRAAAGRWLRDVLRHPMHLFSPIRLQTMGIIQAPDVQPDGRADMCDSCPDMTFWNGTLVNSCRMDEYRLFGGLLTVVEKGKQAVREMRETQAEPAGES
ncbi:MAG: radical SAM protein [Chloroflexi bacterium]|nr:radical SAM protein [Chloroflexota bacterium]